MRPLLVLVAACATTPRPVPETGPRGMHADEHLEQARHHDAMAATAGRVPDRLEPAFPTNMAWTLSWDTAAEHERLAAAHRSQAAAIEAAYEEACGARPAAEVSVSPLVLHGLAVWNTSTGVILYLSPDAGPADHLLAAMKCHRAWMMLTHVETMDDCPLDLPGIQVDARGGTESITVSIVARDPNLVEELHRRAAHDLEMGAQLRTAPR